MKKLIALILFFGLFGSFGVAMARHAGAPADHGEIGFDKGASQLKAEFVRFESKIPQCRVDDRIDLDPVCGGQRFGKCLSGQKCVNFVARPDHTNFKCLPIGYLGPYPPGMNTTDRNQGGQVGIGAPDSLQYRPETKTNIVLQVRGIPPYYVGKSMGVPLIRTAVVRPGEWGTQHQFVVFGLSELRKNSVKVTDGSQKSVTVSVPIACRARQDEQNKKPCGQLTTRQCITNSSCRWYSLTSGSVGQYITSKCVDIQGGSGDSACVLTGIACGGLSRLMCPSGFMCAQLSYNPSEDNDPYKPTCISKACSLSSVVR